MGKEVCVLEVGVYSGGSLDMWREYFGSMCTIYGVDIQKSCKSYENENTKIFIGDQSDRTFWRTVKNQIAPIDVLIDDGSHKAEHQIVTLEEMLPHIRPGGVYVCEDIHGSHNRFSAYMQGLVANLNTMDRPPGKKVETGIPTTHFQSFVGSIHLYPYVAVLEKADWTMEQMICPKHGTEWQPVREPADV